MDVFGNALDVIIVGVLAIPWVLIAYHLFFPDSTGYVKTKNDGYGQPTHGHADLTDRDAAEPAPSDLRVKLLLTWVKSQNQTAVAGVLLLALAYSLGSVVSRVAQDFLDDEDLQVWNLHWPTETSIRIQVYGQLTQNIKKQAPSKHESTTTATQPSDSGKLQNQSYCSVSGEKESPGNILFHIHEAALLLRGTDDNERLRQYHYQITVLRGAAFSGLIAFSLCFFWWTTGFKWGWLAPVLYSVPVAIAGRNHFCRNEFSEPPYMEFTWLALALVGFCLFAKYGEKNQRRERHEKQHGNPHEYKKEGNKRQTRRNPGKIAFGYLLLAVLITLTAYLGWWATEILYDQQVIYSYKALSDSSNASAPESSPSPSTPSTPSPK